MNWSKNLYVFMLGAVIVFSGCFGTGTTDGDDGDVDDSGTNENPGGDDTTSNGNSGSGSATLLPDNLPPVISIDMVGNNPSWMEGSDCTTTGMSIEARHAMTDWDGTIVNAGWDIDLDGNIDYSVTADEGYTTLEMPMSALIWYNTSEWGDGDSSTYGYAYLQNSFAFGAEDDDGEWTSSEIITLSERAYWGYEHNYGTSLDTETCRDFNVSTGYNFSITDHTDSITHHFTDNLVNIARTNGLSGLSWDEIRVSFDGNDAGPQICTVSYNSSTSGCTIVQSGGDSLYWEAGESITLKESNWDLHRPWGNNGTNGTGDFAEIRIEILREGTQNTWDTAEIEVLLLY